MSSTTRRLIVSWAQVPGTVDVSMAGIGANFGVALRIFVGAIAAAPVMAARRAWEVCMPRRARPVASPLEDSPGVVARRC
mmetsp:Transcript_25051/g.76281  ORF Transcript_25051/g.76281 Transcript_25051/m.76281 type:complete len:80 (-) Transcript_25051:1186-1425(-)